MSIELPSASARVPASRSDLTRLDLGPDKKLRGTDSAGADVVIVIPGSPDSIPNSAIGAANGVAPLGSDSKVPAANLPSYVDDVLEFANLAAFPATGETGKIYVAVNGAIPSNPSKQYRWSGSTYTEVSPSPGSTDAIAEGITNLYHTPARAVAAGNGIYAPRGPAPNSGLTVSGPNKLLGRRSAGVGALEEFDIGAGLLVSAEGVLSATGSGSGSNFGRTKLPTTQSTASVTYADITGLNFPVLAGKSYYFEFNIDASVNSTATGARFSVNGPAFTRLAYRTYSTQAASGASAVIPTYSNAYDLPAGSTTASPYVDGNLHIVSGVIKAASDGSVTARFAAESGSSGTVFANADTTFVTFFEIADVATVSPTGSVVIRQNGDLRGTATTIDLIGLTVSFAAGIATITAAGGGGNIADALGLVIADADNTAAASAVAGLNLAAYAACGLNSSGVGTVQNTPKPIFLKAGQYDVQNFCPRDTAGHALPITFVAYPGTVRMLNKLSRDSTTKTAGINLDYTTWQEANKFQQAVSAVTVEFAPATFGIENIVSNREPATCMTVPDASGFAPGQMAHICCRNHLPYSDNIGSSTRSRIGETFRIGDVDYAANKVYAVGTLEWQDFYETDVYLTRMDERRTFQSWGVDFGAAPTLIGNTTATPDTLDHGLFAKTTQSITSITKTLNSGVWTALATTANPHNLLPTMMTKVEGANEPQYNIVESVIATPSANSFTYVLRTKTDISNLNFGRSGRVGSAGITLSSTPQTLPLVVSGSAATPASLYATVGQATVTASGTVFSYSGKTDNSLLNCVLVSGPGAIANNDTVTQDLNQISDTATGTIVYRDAFAGLEDATHNRCVNLTGCVAPKIRETDIRFPWMQVFGFNCCPEASLKGVSERGTPNAGTGATNFDGGRIGYVVACNGATSNLIWSGDGTVFDSRHLYTDGAAEVAFTPTQPNSAAGWVNLGLPTGTVLQGIYSRNCSGFPFDLHEHGKNTTFIDCHAYKPTRGYQGGSYSPGGWHVRGAKFNAINCSQDGGNYGVRQSATEILGEAYRWADDVNNNYQPLLYSVTSAVNAAGTLTLVLGAANNGVNNGVHINPGEMFRLRHPTLENYNAFFMCLTNDDATRTVTATMATRSLLAGLYGVNTALVGGSATYPATGTTLTCSASINLASYPWRGTLQVPGVTGLVSYNGISGAGFLNCTGGTGTATPGAAITYAYAPASAPNPTGPELAQMTMQPYAFTTHRLQNFQIKGITKGNGGGLWARAQSTIGWKSQWEVQSIHGSNVPSVVLAEADARVNIGIVTAAQLWQDISRENSGSMICVSGNGQVYAGEGILDCSVSTSNPVLSALENPGVSPGKLLGSNGSILFGTLSIKQHSQYMVCPRIFTFKNAAITGNKIGVGTFNYADLNNVGSAFCITAPGEESKFIWVGGGSELYIPTQTNTLTTGAVQIGQRGIGSKFLLRRAAVVLDGNAVGTVTVDVRIGSTSVFGANKVRVLPGANLSTAGTQPTYLTTILPDMSNLTVTGLSSSGSETAKCNGVLLSGFAIG
ncbi:hypothetical protein [Nevskia ramosa]|uniref:hypothetical protein n=1 Tax=Nevskia ramosa TaxID=64002 RepID=UPI003D14832F